MTKPQNFTPQTVLQNGDLWPFLRDSGGGNFVDSNITISQAIQLFSVDIVENVTTATDINLATDIVYFDATSTATLPDPSTAYKKIYIRAMTGTGTIATAAGTTERTTLTVGQSVTLGPRATEWVIL